MFGVRADGGRAYPRRMTPSDVLDLHLTRLVGWLVRTIGRAILYAAAVSLVVAGLGAFADSAGLVVIGFALGPLVGAIYLATADAPMPIEVDQDA